MAAFGMRLTVSRAGVFFAADGIDVSLTKDAFGYVRQLAHGVEERFLAQWRGARRRLRWFTWRDIEWKA